MIGHKLLIHNGKKFVSREVTQEMIGYKMGVFSPTRQLGSHGKAGKR
jgi:small subunit ribosomal protein S19